MPSGLVVATTPDRVYELHPGADEVVGVHPEGQDLALYVLSDDDRVLRLVRRRSDRVLLRTALPIQQAAVSLRNEGVAVLTSAALFLVHPTKSRVVTVHPRST